MSEPRAGDETPCIVVLDEVPWLIEQDGEFEGSLQTAWDRYLSARPILLILVGSDLSVMESLQEYGRPFFGRAAHMPLSPLALQDVADMTGLPAADAVDALLITGGFPEVVRSWERGMSRIDFLRPRPGHRRICWRHGSARSALTIPGSRRTGCPVCTRQGSPERSR